MPRAPSWFLLAALTGAGCAVLSDFHTSGYSLIDSGVLSCEAASECDAGLVCCVASLSPVTARCQAAPCANVSSDLPYPVQICQTNAECGAPGCFDQTCPLASTGFAACGTLPVCTSTPIDAGALDAGTSMVVDAASAPPIDAPTNAGLTPDG